jgi:predicted RND superfamily exporter protein
VALSVLIVFFLTLFFFAIGVYRKRIVIKLHYFIERSIEMIVWLTNKYYRQIFFGMTAIALLLSLGLAKLSIGSNLFEYFKKDAPIRQEMRLIEERLTGLVAIDVVLDTHKSNGAIDPAFLNDLYLFVQKLRKKYPQLRKHPTILDTLSHLYHSMEPEAKNPLPKERSAISQLLLLLEMSSADQKIDHYFDQHRRYLHLSLLSNEVGSKKSKTLIEEIKRYHYKNISVEINGSYPLFIEMQEGVIKTFFYSIGFTFLLLFVLSRFVFGSAKEALFVVGVNLLPILITFGLLGYAGISLDLGFAMSFAIILSIAIDDTMHFMWRYSHYRAQYDDAIERTTKEAGAGMLVSSVVLFAGFSLFSLSQFVPNIHFGLSVAIAILAALIYDAIWLPAYLYYKRRKEL